MAAASPIRTELIVAVLSAVLLAHGTDVVAAAKASGSGSAAQTDASVATALVPTAADAGYELRVGHRSSNKWNKHFGPGLLDSWDGNFGRPSDHKNAEFGVFVFKSEAYARGRFKLFRECALCREKPTSTSIGIVDASASTETFETKHGRQPGLCTTLVSVRRAVLVLTLTCGYSGYTSASARRDSLRIHRLVHHDAFAAGL